MKSTDHLMNVINHQTKALEAAAIEVHVLKKKWKEGPLTETEHRHLAQLRLCLGTIESKNEKAWKLLEDLE